MAVEVLVVESGSTTIALGPGSPAIRVRPNTKQVWLWPILEKGAPGYEDVPPLPKRWQVQRTLGEEELEERLKGMTFVKPDPQRNRLRVKDMPGADRESRESDKELVAKAVAALDDEENEHWTRAGLPQIQAVREIVERIEEKRTGEREWPSWVTRELLDGMVERKRGDCQD